MTIFASCFLEKAWRKIILFLSCKTNSSTQWIFVHLLTLLLTFSSFAGFEFCWYLWQILVFIWDSAKWRSSSLFAILQDFWSRYQNGIQKNVDEKWWKKRKLDVFLSNFSLLQASRYGFFILSTIQCFFQRSPVIYCVLWYSILVTRYYSLKGVDLIDQLRNVLQVSFEVFWTTLMVVKLSRSMCFW